MKTLTFAAICTTIALGLGFLGTAANGATLYTAGNTHPTLDQPSGGSTEVESIVNFAVYVNDGGGWSGLGLGALLGSSTPTLDQNATYLYLFQASNIGVDSVHDIAFPGVTTAFATSWGYFDNSGFNYNGTNISTTQSIGPLATAGSQSGFNLGGGTLTIISDGSLFDPTRPGNSVIVNSSDFRVFFTDANDEDLLTAGLTTVIFGYTTNTPPIIGDVSVRNSVTPEGTVPEPGVGEAFPPVPEPASLAIWGLGLGVVGFVGYKRRKRVAG